MLYAKPQPNIYREWLDAQIVQEYLSICRDEIAAGFGLTDENILDELSVIAFADPADITDEKGDYLPIGQLPGRIRRAISNVEIVNRPTRGGRETGVRYAFHPKMRALEAAMKYKGLFEKDNDQRGNAQNAISRFFEQAQRATEGIAPRSLPSEVGQTADRDRRLDGPDLEKTKPLLPN